MKAFILPTKNIMTTAYYYSILERIFKKAGFDEVILCKGESLKGYKVNRRKDFIMTGNPYPTLKMLVRGYKNVGTWYQGCGPEERKMQGSSWLHVKLYEIMEILVLRFSAFHIFVSNALVKHLFSKYKIHINPEEYAVMPCFNDNAPNLNCFKPGVKRPLSFVYSGGMGVWQCFDETLNVFKQIKTKCPDASLDIYTYQVEEAKESVRRNGIDGVYVQYIPKEKMNEALLDKMYGFVLRIDDPVNNVATPTKLSNYMANGVIPICSTTVKDFSEATKNNTYVIHVNNHKVNEIADEIINKVSEIENIYSAENHYKENNEVFETYYSEDKYIGIISDKIKSHFMLS